jgi:hypothetical protein
MSNNYDYPAGTFDDPLAPWNDKDEEPKRTIPEVCPICGGPVYVNSYSVECTDFENCEFIIDID